MSSFLLHASHSWHSKVIHPHIVRLSNNLTLWRFGERWVTYQFDLSSAARIGKSILLDHGTGVVIGETAIVGDRVSILQVNNYKRLLMEPLGSLIPTVNLRKGF